MLAAHDEDLADALVMLARGVVDAGVGAQHAGPDAEEVELAHVGIGGRLEDEGGERGVYRRLALLLRSGIGMLPRHRLALERAGNALDDQIEQRLNADIVGARAKQDREEGALANALLDSANDILAGDLLLHEVLVTQLLIHVSQRLDQRVTILRDGIGQFRRHGAFLRLLALAPGVGFVADDIDDAAEAQLGAHRHLHSHGRLAKARADIFHHALKVGVLAPHLVDEEDARKVVLIREAPVELGAYLYSGHGVHEHDRPFDNAQGAANIRLEIDEARSIDDVELVALPLQGSECRAYGDLSFGLVLFVVGDRVALFDSPHASGDAGVEEHGLRKRGLARSPMGDQGDIPDLARFIRFHLISISFSKCPPGMEITEAGTPGPPARFHTDLTPPQAAARRLPGRRASQPTVSSQGSALLATQRLVQASAHIPVAPGPEARSRGFAGCRVDRENPPSHPRVPFNVYSLSMRTGLLPPQPRGSCRALGSWPLPPR